MHGLMQELEYVLAFTIVLSWQFTSLGWYVAIEFWIKHQQGMCCMQNAQPWGVVVSFGH